MVDNRKGKDRRRQGRQISTWSGAYINEKVHRNSHKHCEASISINKRFSKHWEMCAECNCLQRTFPFFLSHLIFLFLAVAQGKWVKREPEKGTAVEKVKAISDLFSGLLNYFRPVFRSKYYILHWTVTVLFRRCPLVCSFRVPVFGTCALLGYFEKNLKL